MKTDSLQAMLIAFRTFRDFIAGSGEFDGDAIAALTRTERMLSDHVMFCVGWRAAKEGHNLEDSSVELLASMLLAESERIRVVADAIRRKQEAEQKLKNKGGAPKKRDDEGYFVVLTMIRLHPEKRVADHIRWGLKNGWLKKDVSDKNHRARIDLLRKEMDEIERRQIKALGNNVVTFPGKLRNGNFKKPVG